MSPHSQKRLLRQGLTVGLHFALLMTLVGLTPAPMTRADERAPTGGEIQIISADSRPAQAGPGRVAPTTPQGQGFQNEVEPNGTFVTASPLIGGNLVVRANLFPNGDIDFYSFTATAGDRVYAAAMTSFSAGNSTDSQLTLLASDGTTVIEFDDDNGSFAGLSSSIAGAVITTTGTYYLKVNDFTAGTTSERGYELHLQLQSGVPTPEVETNDTPATANPLAAGGWMTGTRNPALATEQDWYSFTLSAGDSVFLSLDLDPERDGVFWNGRLGLALFGDANNQILVVDDAGASETPNPTRPSEAYFMTVKDPGIYYAFVDSASAATGGPTATYNLSVSVHPAANEGLNCTTYTSVDVPKTIGPGTGVISSTITIPGNPRIADIDVSVQLTHTLMADIDAHLRSPADNDNGLFTDIGAAATGGQTQMDLVLDDEAGIPPAFTVLKGLVIKPELAYRLAWFDGENAGGTWTLDLRDDTANTSGGTLTNWSIRICEPPPPPACSVGTTLTTLFTTDFEASDGGFTHSGTQDEWARGLPTAAPITTCYSGTNCWKTDLTGTYNASSSQNLVSPAIPLTVTGLVGPIYLSWAQRYQMESASFDHAFVDVQQVGGATPTRLWEWLDATQTNSVGNPTVIINESSGWSVYTRTISSYLGQNIEALFHLDSDTTVQLGGLAIDDVSVAGCVTNPNVPPIADAGADQTVNVSATVALDGSGSNDPDNNLPLSYGWAQSGGPAVTLSDPTVVTPTFAAPAAPTVLTFTLTVTDSLNAPSLPASVVITVTDVAISGLTASNDSPTSLGNVTMLSATISAGTNVAYAWDFGDGQLGSGATLTHTYGLVGSYTATVTATNSLGSVNATTLVAITAANTPPIANAGTDQTVNVSATVALDGSGSNDPDNNLPLSYGWAQSGGPAVTLSDPTVVTPTFTAPATPTVLTFTLTVTDSLSAPSLPASVVITVTDVAITGLAASNDSPTLLGNVTTLSATISAGTNVAYAWDFGDGQLGSGATLTHTYGLVGSYTATVTATNSLGSVNATTLVTITAANTPPTISDTGNQTMTLGSPLTFTVTISDVETPVASLVVTGTSANQSIVPNANIVISGSGLTRTITITPLITGMVTITLTVDDGNGGTASDNFDLTVQPSAPVVFRLYLPILRR